MSPLIIFTIIATLLAVCFGQTDDKKDDIVQSLSYVSNECSSKLMNIDSLDGFKEFMRHYRLVIDNASKPKRGLLNFEWRLRKCFDYKDHLLALEEVISKQDEGVCQSNYINSLVDYHLKYIVKNENRDKIALDPSSLSTTNATKTSYAAHIFSLFAHQVSFKCKSKLLDRVQIAQSKEDCSLVLGSFLPEGLLSEEDKVSSPENLDRDKFVTFLNNFKGVEDFVLVFRKTDGMEPHLNVKLIPEMLEKIKDLKNLCRNREPYYRALFLPIATLSQIGYGVEQISNDFEDLKSKEEKILKCWLATAQLCQGVLRIQGENLEQDDTEGKIVQLKFDETPDYATQVKAPIPDVVTFKDFITEINPNIRDLVKKKNSLKGRFKKRAVRWVQSFVEKYVDIKGKQSEVAKSFLNVLSHDDDELDSPVAFNGRRSDNGLYNPVKMIANDSDAIITTIALFCKKEISLVLNMVVAFVLSAAFVWFSIHALAIYLGTKKGVLEPDLNGNFKEDWRNMRNKRMDTMKNKIERKRWSDKIKVYTSRGN